MHVLTFTPNPSLDVSADAEKVTPTDKIRCTQPRYDPGGGGVNVARVVRILGGSATALFPAGGAAGAMLHQLLDIDGVEHRPVPIRGATRESFTINDQQSHLQYRFVLPGPELSRDEQQRCVDELRHAASQARFFVVSGSLPPNVPGRFLAELGQIAKAAGARYIVDTSGQALREAGGVYLAKPSLRELRDLTKRELATEAQQVAAARGLITQGLCEICVVSLGADGALLVQADHHERFSPYSVEVNSAVGAGDSMVAAITVALVRGMSLREAVLFGMAAGAAALMTPGTELCRREDVEQLFQARSSNAPETRNRA